jgi:MerR family copper efflux transcriptional regulator
MQLVTVGSAAQQTGLSAKAIRLYERKGLLAEAERTEAGYRLFTPDDIAVLHFIRRAKTLDLGLDEIKDILDLQRGGEQPCQRVTSMLDTHLADIDQKLADLRRLRDSLRNARRAAATARRDGNPAVVCQIIESAPHAPAPEPPELRASRGARPRLGRG